MSWAELFERAAGCEVTEEEIQQALARHREHQHAGEQAEEADDR